MFHFPSAWTAPDGSVVRSGDVVRFRSRNMTRTASVVGPLIFDDHVVVRFGACGTVVDASNFVAFVRRRAVRRDIQVTA